METYSTFTRLYAIALCVGSALFIGYFRYRWRVRLSKRRIAIAITSEVFGFLIAIAGFVAFLSATPLHNLLLNHAQCVFGQHSTTILRALPHTLSIALLYLVAVFVVISDLFTARATSRTGNAAALSEAASKAEVRLKAILSDMDRLGESLAELDEFRLTMEKALVDAQERHAKAMGEAAAAREFTDQARQSPVYDDAIRRAMLIAGELERVHGKRFRLRGFVEGLVSSGIVAIAVEMYLRAT
ncbi:MAG: hypothetical protein ABFE07_19555 [Armatimonadia bacterium]